MAGAVLPVHRLCDAVPDREQVGADGSMTANKRSELTRTPDGELHLVVTGPWTSNDDDEWEQSGAQSLGYDPEGGHVEFLPTLPGLRRLYLIGRCADDSPVLRCTKLDTLSLHTDCKGALDLSALNELVSLSIEKRLDPGQLPDMNLTSLHYVNWPADTLSMPLKSGTLQKLRLDGVRRLRAINPDRTPARIRSLAMAYGRGEVNAVGLEALTQLVSLELERVKLADYEALGSLAALERLSIVNCGRIPGLDFLGANSNLRHIALTGTIIESGDLSPLDQLPRVVTRYVQPRKEYNRRYVDSG